MEKDEKKMLDKARKEGTNFGRQYKLLERKKYKMKGMSSVSEAGVKQRDERKRKTHLASCQKPFPKELRSKKFPLKNL